MALLSMLGFLVAVTKKPIPKTRIGYRVGDHENNICLTLLSLLLSDMATLATGRTAHAVSPLSPCRRHELGLGAFFGFGLH